MPHLTSAKSIDSSDANTVGDYALLAPLSQGGMGAVHLGEHARTGQRVAVKLLDESHIHHTEIVERMFAEHTVAQAAAHPGLLQVHASGRNAAGVPYLVMELLDGENLGALAERGSLELDAILAIGGQIAAALRALHAGGYAHCDIKADNVFVLYQTNLAGWPRVKVIDFGVARETANTVADTVIAGTPSYMAPEQWRAAPTVQSDVYGLGCLLYQLVTGDKPFHGTLPQLMVAHCQQLAARPSTLRSDVPPELDRLIMRALAKEPGMRPSMRDMEVELARILSMQSSDVGLAAAC